MLKWYGGIMQGVKTNKKREVNDIVITDRPIGVLGFGNSTYNKKTHSETVRPNGRNDYQITFVVNGSLYENYKKTVLKENTAILYKPHQPQFIQITGSDSATTYWIHFSGTDVENILNKYGINSGIIEFEDNFPFFTDIINRMYVAKSNPYWQDICDALLIELLIHIGGAKQRTIYIDSAYLKLTQYMKETCTQNLPIKVYADFIGFSEVYFVRFFKKASKHTPHAYLTELKLEKACNMLIHTDLPINQIATKVGYNTARYFSKAFFDRYGVTPGEYRKKKALQRED